MDVQELSEARYARKLERSVKDEGWGSTDGALAIAGKFIDELTAIVEADLNTVKDTHLRAVLTEIGPEKLALLGLQVGIDSVSQEDELINTTYALGRAVRHEAVALQLHNYDKELATRIERVATQRYRSVKLRRQALLAMAKKNGFRKEEWPPKSLVKAGGFILNAILKCGVFVLDNDRLSVTLDALAISDTLVRQTINRNPVMLPVLEAPPAWGDTSIVLYNGHRIPLMRTSGNKERKALLRQSVVDGSLQPVLDALTAIQAVPWSINEPVLAMVRWAYDNDIKLKKFVTRSDKELPERDETWGEERLTKWRRDASKVREINRSLAGQRWTYTQDMATADWIIENGNRFWCPHNIDYRGRVYPVCHFSFQRGSDVRALFRFAEGKPLGAEGLYWLKVHLANCGDFDKVSKKSFDARVAWVDAHEADIHEYALSPKMTAPEWTLADKPFLFLAACMELSAALRSSNPEAYVSHLPVSFDGSCSGIQHLCAMTRAEEGALVNLTPSDAPQDVYQRVADMTKAQVTKDLADPALEPLAALALAHGVDRKLVKRNVMTYAYSSKAYGMAQQLMDDTMLPLSDQVLTGELAAHPFHHPDLDTITSEETGYTRVVPGMAASRYLARTIYRSVEAVVPKPAEAMRFLQDIARTCAHETISVRWTTPLGLPVTVVHRVKRVRSGVCLFLHSRGVYRPAYVENTPELDKKRMASSIAPCFVHSMDAAHLMLAVLEAKRQGINDMALVHDSFGCHAADAERFRMSIKTTFRDMYLQHDVLAAILVETTDRIETSHDRLPELPEYGTLDIAAITGADYAFA